MQMKRKIFIQFPKFKRINAEKNRRSLHLNLFPDSLLKKKKKNTRTTSDLRQFIFI